MKSTTLREVRHILDFMTEKGVHVLLSQELRQELDLREYPGFPENWDGDTQPENVYGEPTTLQAKKMQIFGGKK